MTLGRRRRPSVVTVANEKVPITVACQMIGMHIADEVAFGRSRKIHCPLGAIYHSDQGAEPAMRIYPETNHAFCFRGCGSFTPVWLVSQVWGVSTTDAATMLLDRIGYKPASLADQWKHASTREVPPDISLLAEALKTYCGRIRSDWSTVQFDPEPAAMLNRCLALLDKVQDDSDAQLWLERTKLFMGQVLDR